MKDSIVKMKKTHNNYKSKGEVAPFIELIFGVILLAIFGFYSLYLTNSLYYEDIYVFILFLSIGIIFKCVEKFLRLFINKQKSPWIAILILEVLKIIALTSFCMSVVMFFCGL